MSSLRSNHTLYSDTMPLTSGSACLLPIMHGVNSVRIVRIRKILYEPGSTWVFAEIEHAYSAEMFSSVCDCQVENHSVFSYGQPKE